VRFFQQVRNGLRQFYYGASLDSFPLLVFLSFFQNCFYCLKKNLFWRLAKWRVPPDFGFLSFPLAGYFLCQKRLADSVPSFKKNMITFVNFFQNPFFDVVSHMQLRPERSEGGARGGYPMATALFFLQFQMNN
jgi:hypothetical protein